MSPRRSDEIDALRDRQPGEDPEDPYEGVDVEELPEWWQRAIDEFDEYGLRPYRPPRFSDGEIAHEVRRALEAELGVTIRLSVEDPHTTPHFDVIVDGTTVTEVPRRREPSGHTVLGVRSEEFERRVREHVGD